MCHIRDLCICYELEELGCILWMWWFHNFGLGLYADVLLIWIDLMPVKCQVWKDDKLDLFSINHAWTKHCMWPCPMFIRLHQQEVSVNCHYQWNQLYEATMPPLEMCVGFWLFFFFYLAVLIAYILKILFDYAMSSW